MPCLPGSKALRRFAEETLEDAKRVRGDGLCVKQPPNDESIHPIVFGHAVTVFTDIFKIWRAIRRTRRKSNNGLSSVYEQNR